MTQVVNKKVKLTLVGLDGNAFFLMGAFQRQARIEGWEKEEIAKVLEECQKSNYDHLVCTLADHCYDDLDSDMDNYDDYDEEEEE